MRPKIRVLLIHPNETERAIMRFVLETSGFAVLSAVSCYEAAEVGRLDAAGPDILLGFFPISDEYLMEVAGGFNRPWLFIQPTGKMWPSMADVLERVRIASARKRGPRKGTPRPPTTVKPASVEACA